MGVFFAKKFPWAAAAARKIIPHCPPTCQEENEENLKKIFLSQNEKSVDNAIVMWYYNYRDKERGATYERTLQRIHDCS